VELLQNALAAAPLVEEGAYGLEEGANRELNIFPSLLNALFKARAIDEVEKILPRFREAAKVDSQRTGGLNYYTLKSFCFFAQLHEVLCIHTLRGGKPSTLLCP